MNLEFILNVKQKQTLVMTPQLNMAIKLLGYSTLEVDQYIREMVKENPLLEMIDKQYEYREQDKFEESGNSFNYESFISRELSLYDYLESQLYQILSKDELNIGRYIIGNLDDRGFLTMTAKEITELFKINENNIKRIINKIQQLEPPGISASGYKEALLIQLQLLDNDTELEQKIVNNYIADVAEDNYDKISNVLNVELYLVKRAVKLIKSLNPYPAAGFYQGNDIDYIIPDLIVIEREGQYLLQTNNLLPKLNINQDYYHLLRKSEDNDSIDYLNKKYKEANWLMKSIKQRQENIYNIAKVIVKEQKDFLSKGIKNLYSMTMTETAEKLGLNESTVSRASSEKYIQTPWGLFELKFFFSPGIGKISSHSIKAYVTEFISEENPESPLSDRQIAELFVQNLNLEISRRTVAKYRSKLGFLSSQRRRRKINI